MIRLFLQMFGGRGGSSGVGAGGGGTKADGKSSAPAPVSSNAPGHHGSAGGRKMDGGGGGATQVPKQGEIRNDLRYNIDRISDGKARFFEDNLSGKDVKGVLGSGYKYDSEKDEYVDKYGRRYKVYLTRKK